MTSSEYRNTVYWTLHAHTPADETDLLVTARRIFNNLGVPFPQGTLADAIQILSSGDYMGWSICNADLAQQCANFGYPAIAVNENTLSFILPDEHTIAVNSPVAAVDHSIIWNHNTTSSGNPSTQFFVFARLLDNRDVSSENQVAYSSRNNDIMVAAAAATTCSSSCQVACQSGCQKSCQSCNTCQSVCETTCQDICQTNCQTGCQVSCQSCNTCQSSCQLSCQSCNTCQAICETSCQDACESSSQTISQYTITYNYNYAGSTNTTANVTPGDCTSLPYHSRDGYDCIGWYSDPSGGEKIGNEGDCFTPSTSITLYALWVTTYTITFNYNGGSGFPASRVVHSGSSISLPSASLDGFEFLGWYTAAIGGTKIGVTGDSFSVTCNITLYAQWITIDYLITKQNLIDMGWSGVTEERVSDLRKMQLKYGITTLERVRHFFGQCGTESSAGWLREGEYMLISNGGTRTQQEYEDYYNTKHSYGYKYRGCGYLQTTFDYWYYAFATYMICQTYPELNTSWRSPANTGLETIKEYYSIAVSAAKTAGKNITEFTDIVDLGCDYTATKYAAEISGFRWHAGGCNNIVDNCISNGITGNAAVAEVSKNIAGYTVSYDILNQKITWYNIVCSVIN